MKVSNKTKDRDIKYTEAKIQVFRRTVFLNNRLVIPLIVKYR